MRYGLPHPLKNAARHNGFAFQQRPQCPAERRLQDARQAAAVQWMRSHGCRWPERSRKPSRLLQTLVMRPILAILHCMTRVLESAFAEAAKLPPEEQDRIGQWLLSELADEREWDERFCKSQDLLARLADEALEEVARGEVTDLDPAKL